MCAKLKLEFAPAGGVKKENSLPQVGLEGKFASAGGLERRVRPRGWGWKENLPPRVELKEEFAPRVGLEEKLAPVQLSIMRARAHTHTHTHTQTYQHTCVIND